MTEIEILSSTYDDICTVYRPILKDVDGEALYLDKDRGAMVYQDIPCALSSIRGGRLQKKSLSFINECDYSLFVAPSINIYANDYVVVNRLGMEYRLIAGAADRQASHNQVFLKNAEPLL